ncbi:DUF11 domain-containing protein [Desulfatibacillum aliphaticivorans]|uniref:DUF11 domain-containing protein n=1 Tax=Desulfatibacillum aliphaticivorans TaxID=218208 RepID=UPI0012FB1980|nr:DUF11 domain-containing protein [Desulfatibacillum aliphaticivorans]
MKKPAAYMLIRMITAILLTALLAPASALAWPAASEWNPLLQNGAFLLDPNGDAQGSRNIVSDATHAAAYIYNDGTYIYFRMRLDQNPQGTGGQGLLQPYGWGFEFDTDSDPTSYEWLLILDGISKTENIILEQNTVQQSIDDPSDASEIDAFAISVSGNYLINLADTSFNGDQDYFLDFRFPYSTFLQMTGLSDSSPIRVFGGSSSSANALTERGADLLGSSTLSGGFTDIITPTGTTPTDGSVKFVENLAGTGDMTAACPGDALFVRVIDGDKNYVDASPQTLEVTLTVPSGDSETIVLTETGVNTSWFTGSIPTAAAASHPGDGTLQVFPGETATVTYVDEITADGSVNLARTDSLVMGLPAISIAKTTPTPSVTSGGYAEYTITVTNSGCGAGAITQIQDVLPGNFTYQAGSTQGLTATDPALSGQVLTWSGPWSVPPYSHVNLSFQVYAGTASGVFYNNASVSGANFAQVSTGDAAPVTVIAPLLEIEKNVDKTNAKPGEELIYSIHYHNIGSDAAHDIVITDEIPAFTAFLPGSLRIGPADGDYASATPVTDAGDGDEGAVIAPNIVFVIPLTGADDGVPGSGPDEGKAYFKVLID